MRRKKIYDAIAFIGGAAGVAFFGGGLRDIYPPLLNIFLGTCLVGMSMLLVYSTENRTKP